MKALVLLPTYNERENLEKMVAAILAQDLGLDILIIDDNSPDGTGQIAERLKQHPPFEKGGLEPAPENLLIRGGISQIDVLHCPQKQGLGKAYVQGFRVALERGYDKIITMDCDFSHNPNTLARLLEASKTHDLVLGSRYVAGSGVKGWSLWRKILSRGGSWYARLVLGLPYHDLTGGFKCYSARALLALPLDKVCAHGYSFLIETTYRIHKKGFSIQEIPILFEDRRVGKSKMSFAIALEAVWVVLKIKFFP